eukprot:1763015-Amphidinium_carterae.2
MYRPDNPSAGSHQTNTHTPAMRQTAEAKAKAKDTPALEKAMPAQPAKKRAEHPTVPTTSSSKRVAGDANVAATVAKAPGLTRPSEVDIVDLVADGEADLVVDDYDSNVPAPLLDQAATNAIDSVADDRVGQKRRRTSTSGTLVGVPSPGNPAPLSVSWTRFGLHERLTHNAKAKRNKKASSGAALAHVAPWDEAPPPSQTLNNRDRISAISNFVNAAVSAPWRQAAPVHQQNQIVVPPPPPVRTAPAVAPPPPQQLVIPTESNPSHRSTISASYHSRTGDIDSGFRYPSSVATCS